MKASEFLSMTEKAAIAEAVREAEKSTSVEIVPILVSASGRYDRAEDIVGLLTALAAFSLTWSQLQAVIPASGDWASGYTSRLPLAALLAVIVGGFWLGAAAATAFPALKLPFLSRREIEEEVERGADAAFHRFRVRRTTGGTGLAIYVSLLERHVRVVGDAALQDALSQEEWDSIRDALLAGIRGNHPGEGFCSGIRKAGEVLGRKLPIKTDDLNELPNELTVID